MHGKFSVGYAELAPLRPPARASRAIYHLLEPMEFHADTTRTGADAQEGPSRRELDAEAWDRLVTWIDLNCPFHGTWSEELPNPGTQRRAAPRTAEALRRRGRRSRGACPARSTTRQAVAAGACPSRSRETGPQPVACPGWPFDAAEAQRRQQAAGPACPADHRPGRRRRASSWRSIPAGEFVMGMRPAPGRRAAARHACGSSGPSGWPRARSPIGSMRCFDPRHDSRVESKNAYQFGVHGYPANRARAAGGAGLVERGDGLLPLAFRGRRAGGSRCRPRPNGNTPAGPARPRRSSTATWTADFSKFANLADAKLVEFASNVWNTVDSR